MPLRRLALFLLVALVAACASSAPTSPDDGSQAPVRAADQAYADAWLSNSRAQIEATLTDDAVLIPSGMTPKEGPAIQAFWWPDDSPPTTVTVFELDQREVRRTGEQGYVRGSFELEFEYDGSVYRNGGEYLSILRVDADGVWRIAVRMWSDRPRTTVDP